MTAEERLVVFECAGDRLVGVLHLPANPLPVGILLIGRWGSDRLSVHLGRAGGDRGVAVFRFDLRGRDDCEGPLVGVEETGEDLRAALNTFLSEAPSIRRVIIFGLSEGAAAALLYARGDKRVAGLILVNPWIRMDQAVAKEHVRRNLSRVLDRHFWHRIRNSEDGYRGAARSFIILTRNWIEASRKRPPATGKSLKDKLMDSLGIFQGPLQIILSGEDPATAIFQTAAREKLQELDRARRLTIVTEPEANHVFSRSDWRAKLIDWTLDWTKATFS
jgi:exosortase A-associated hydrolase 1